ncbi:MAG TPA: PEP-CTERM sorting domain-containing protein [Tepidisphaeraceae bacterium]|jgi:hypothetical protein|nr:PEP-CTERM sorting domain-containing protein [Tepidisphaeraceae bacterium]
MKRLAIIAAAGVSLCAAAARAGTILDDTFTYSGGPGSTTPYVNNASIIGQQPDTANLPGGVYSQSNSAFTSSIDTNGVGQPVPSDLLGPQNAQYVPLQSNGIYVEPSSLTVSMDIRLGSIAGTDAPMRGMALGFDATNSANTPDAGNGINGVLLDTQGNLKLMTSTVNGGLPTTTTLIPYSAASFGGNAFSNNTFYTLQYSVDTTTGAITNLSLFNTTGSESLAAAGIVAALTGSGTNYLAVQSSGNDGNAQGAIDNLMVSSPTPEPTSIGLLGLASLGLLIRRRRN